MLRAIRAFQQSSDAPVPEIPKIRYARIMREPSCFAPAVSPVLWCLEQPGLVQFGHTREARVTGGTFVQSTAKQQHKLHEGLSFIYFTIGTVCLT